MTNSRSRCLLLVCLFLGLSGCTSKEPLFNFSPFPEPEAAEELVGIDDASEPPAELLPEPVEAEREIDQELDALAQTGSWDEQTPLTAADIQEYDFPIVINKQVKMYLELFQTRHRKYMELWLSRSTRYLPTIHRELEKAGLPKDLAYLAMIESGYNQLAYSRAHAVGMWQFMKGTGTDYSLKVDNYVDERRHALKSTKAAICFLRDLHTQFNDWHLAVAAYNAGPGKIRYGLKKYDVNDFWKLAEEDYLSMETKRYVPKLIAAIIISKNPEKYGFTNVAYMPPMEYDTIEVGPGLTLEALALISGSSKKEIGLLNQELKTDRTPANQASYKANIPKGSYSLASRNISRLHSVVKTNYKTHIIGKNENLTAISKKYNVNKTTLLKVNNLRSGNLAKGQRLRIPYGVVDYVLLPENATSVAQSDSLILHTVKSGETISKIAKQYSVPAEMIISWNGLKDVRKIQSGQQLALYIVGDSPLTASSAAAAPAAALAAADEKAEEDNTIVLAEKKKATPAIDAASDKESFRWYMVKNGDTLWNISQRFNTSPNDIKSLNKLKSNLIHPGSKLKLKDV